MVEHDLLHVIRDPQSNRRIQLIPFNKIEVGSPFDDQWEPGSECEDEDGERFEKSEDDYYRQATITFGQTNGSGELNGIGRKIMFWSGGAGIWEGQFKEDLLDGFGRGIVVYRKGMFSSYIGYWKENDYHGHGKMTVPITKYNLEGLFEEGEYKINGDGIKSYDCKKDAIA